MPDLLHKLGLGKHAKHSCKSPFRDDKNPSWGIYRCDDGTWRFKDQATGERGDEIGLLARNFRLDEKRDFKEILSIYSELAGYATSGTLPKPTFRNADKSQNHKLDLSSFSVGSETQIKSLARSRPYGLEGLKWASNRGVLLFGRLFNQDVYVVTDKSQRLAEARRIDGAYFPEIRGTQIPKRKCHTLRGSSKSWPLGIEEAIEYASITLVEGSSDFLQMHHEIIVEGQNNGVTSKLQWAPVAVLSSGVSIAESSLPFFKDKEIRIFPHWDPPGRKAAKIWRRQLQNSGARRVVIFSLEGLTKSDGQPALDVCDCLQLSTGSVMRVPDYKRRLSND